MVVENNTIIGSPHAFVGNTPRDPNGLSSVGWQPAIIAAGISWGRLSNNITPLMAIRAESVGMSETNNFVYKPRVLNDGANPGKSFAKPLLAGDLPLSAFAVLPQSDNGKSGRGADIRRVGPDAAIRDPDALMREAVALTAAARRQDLTKDLPPPQ